MENHVWRSTSPHKLQAMRIFDNFFDVNRKEQLSLFDTF